jgi:hypothetical protein
VTGKRGSVGRSERWYSSWVINSFRSISAITCGGGLGWRCETRGRSTGGVGEAPALVRGEGRAESRRGKRDRSESKEDSSGGTTRTTRSGHISDMSVSWSVHLTEVAAGGLLPLDFASFCCRQLIRSNLYDQFYLVLQILFSSPGEVIVFTPGPIFLEIRPLVGLMMSFHIEAIKRNVREFHPFLFICCCSGQLLLSLRKAQLLRVINSDVLSDQLCHDKTGFVSPCTPAP